MIKFDIIEPFNRLFEICEKLYGEINYDIHLAELDDGEDDFPLGQTDFENKRILIHVNQTIPQMLDICAHELAHAISGFESEHNDKWKSVYESLNTEFNKSYGVES